MLEVLQTDIAQAVIYSALLAMLVTVGGYVVRRFRDRISDDRPGTQELLSNFRELHSQGDISEAEYRTIRTVLGERLHGEFSDNGSEG